MKNEKAIEGYELIQVHHVGRFTFTEIKKDKIHAVGVARLGKGDRYSDDRAKLISLGRAKKALLKKLEGKIPNEIFEG